MKVKAIGKRFCKAFKQSWPSTTILAIAWLILGFLKSFGINTILLYPFHFISGALMGVDGGSFIGGIVGKTILLLLLNSLLKPLFMNRQNKKTRMKTSFKLLFTSALKKIPNFSDIKQLFTRNPHLLGFNVIGIGLAFLVYPFITGNGQLQNTGVCLVIAIALLREVKKQRGLFITLINSFFNKYHYKQIDKGLVNRVFSGNALGFAITVLFSAISGSRILSLSLGGFLVVAGFVILVVSAGSHKMKSEVAG